jgi:hypothetical protein
MVNELNNRAKAYRKQHGLPENCVITIAKANDRVYITPEDITEAFKSNDETTVRLDVLEVLGDISGFGAEDRSLCAYVAYMGKPDHEIDSK